MAAKKEDQLASKTEDAPAKEATYTLAGVLKAKRYTGQVDILSSILSNSKRYTFSEVDSLLEKFLKKKIN
jgi:hypothetical protein